MTFDGWDSPTDGVIDAFKKVGKYTVTFRADEVRRKAGTVNARIGIGVNSTVVAEDKGDFGTLRKKQDLVNAVYGTSRGKDAKFGEELMSAYPKAVFEHDLLLFSRQFYKELLGREVEDPTAGDEELTEIECIIDGMVLKEGGTILYAPPKSSKSYTAMLMAVSADAGLASIWPVVEQTRVLYINLERGQKGMARRLGVVNRVLGLEPKRPLLMLNRRGRTLSDVYDVAKEMIRRHEVGLVFLDSISRGGFGNLNDNDSANESMDMLNALCPAWVAIGHTPRNDGSHVFGSQMFDAAMDVGIPVRRQRKKDAQGNDDPWVLGVRLDVRDTNDLPPVERRILAYEFDQYGLRVVRDADPGEFPELESELTDDSTSGTREVEDRGLRSFAIDALMELENADIDAIQAEIERRFDTKIKKASLKRTLYRYRNRNFWLSNDGTWSIHAIPVEDMEGEEGE